MQLRTHLRANLDQIKKRLDQAVGVRDAADIPMVQRPTALGKLGPQSQAFQLPPRSRLASFLLITDVADL